MRFALVGIGRWGKTVIKSIQQMGPTSSLVATCSRSPSSLPPELQVAPHYLDYDTMLSESSPDTVIIATHPNSHYELASKALWRNKNVLCEKPCMFTQEQLWSIKELSSGCVFHTDYTNLHHRVITRIKERVWELPPRFQLNLKNSGVGPVREDYSDLWDYGSHVASVIFDVFPEEHWYDIKFGHDEVGNHTLTMSSSWADVSANFGNKSKERVHSFELIHQSSGLGAYWANDKSENPLLTLLQKFEKGEIETNINLSLRIQWLLKQGE